MAGKNKSQNTLSSSTATFIGGLTEDNQRFYMKPQQWIAARNATVTTARGDLGDISNEPANRQMVTISYPIIGGIHIRDGQWAIFSTDRQYQYDNLHNGCEIGLFNEKTDEYTIFVRDCNLHFDQEHLIKGASRVSQNCYRRIYWDDDLNPTRTFSFDELDDYFLADKTPMQLNGDCVEYRYYAGDGCNFQPSGYTHVDITLQNRTSLEPIFFQIDLNKIRLNRTFKGLGLTLNQGTTSGEINNGTFCVFGAYMIDDQIVTEYLEGSNLQHIFNHHNLSGSLTVTVDADTEAYDYFMLSIFEYANGNFRAKQLGKYSTRTTTINIDRIDENLPDEDYKKFVGLHPLYEHSKACVRLGSYLLRLSPTRKWDFPYQHQANNIQAHWAIIERPWDYYRNGGHYVGYMRDEVYAFYIRFVFADGERSRSYHIPGRAAVGNELENANGNDTIFEDNYAGDPNNPTEKMWEVYNTASLEEGNEPEFVPDDNIDDDSIICHGRMGYWESSEKYPDNDYERWGDLCGKHIRHHKFPSNTIGEYYNDAGSVTAHYKGNKIRILGVYFTNIEYPECDIDGIVGYEILRASREGNKTVLAKGMINNMRMYKLKPSDHRDVLSTNQYDLKDYYYPNYPYNPTTIYKNGKVCDHFLNEFKTTSKGLFNNIEVQPNQNGLRYNELRSSLNIFRRPELLDNSINFGDFPLGSSGDANGWNWHIGNISKNIFTFHSPDTMFRTPFLSAKELKVYGTMYGDAEGMFIYPNNHPKHKFISDKMYLTALILGVGHAIVKMKGKKKESLKDATVGDSGTTSGAGMGGVLSSGLGMGPGLMPHMIKTLADAGKTAANKAITYIFDDSIMSTMFTMMGFKPHKWGDSIRNAFNITSASMGGTGQEITTEYEESMFSSMPPLLRLICGGTTFITYWAQGIDDIIEMFYLFSNYRQHALQQVSHCFYDKFSGERSNITRGRITNSSYVNPTFVNFDNEKVINNLHRSRTVALEIDKMLDFPFEHTSDTLRQYRDDSQKTLGELSITQDIPFESVNDGESRHFTLKASSYYTAIKQRITNQYGGIFQNLAQIPITNKVLNFELGKKTDKYSTPVLFGGDTYIGRYTEKNNMPFFYNWLNKQPNGTEFDYSKYINIPYPRYWMNTEKFTSSDMLGNYDDIDRSTDPALGDFDIYECVEGTEPCDCGHEYMNDVDGEDSDSNDVIYSLEHCKYYQQHRNLYRKFDAYKTLSYYGNVAIELLEEIAAHFAEQDDSDSDNNDNDYEYNIGVTYVANGQTVENVHVYTHQSYSLGPVDNSDILWAQVQLATGQTLTSLTVISSQDNSDFGIDDDDPRCDARYRKLLGRNGNKYEFNNNEISDNHWPSVLRNKVIIPRHKKLSFTTSITTDSEGNIVIGAFDDVPTGPYKRRLCSKYLEEGKGLMAKKIKKIQNKISNWNKKANRYADKIQSKELKGRTDRMNSGNTTERLMSRLFVSPTEKFAFDSSNNRRNKFFGGWKDSYMYLYVSGVRDFFVETTYNIDCRDWGETLPEQHYDQQNNTDLIRLFDMDYITKGNHMKIDRSLESSRMPWNYHNMFGLLQDFDYDAEDYKKCHVYYPNRIIYSYPMHSDEIKHDWWRITPLLNKSDFMSRPVNVKEVQDGSGVVLLNNDSPVMFKENAKAEPMQNPLMLSKGNILNNEYEYEQASCQNFYSAVNTPAGLFYMNVSQGKIFMFSSKGPIDITSGEMKSWFDAFGEFKLLKHFPDFELTDNSVIGIGCQTVYNNETGIVYFIKRDYEPTEHGIKELTYVEGGRFSNGILHDINVHNGYYFKDASWTISYNPATKKFVSFHDWHPNMVFGSRNTFMSVDNGWYGNQNTDGKIIQTKSPEAGNSIWEHNERTDLYCNYYGKDYPFEVEIPFVSKGTVDTLKNFIYYMEVYMYDKNGYDRFHVLDFNFDEAVVYNSEQCSGLLKLTLKKKNDPRCLYDYPKIGVDHIDILYSKEEHKYKFNQFYDIVKDRGEFNINHSNEELIDDESRLDYNSEYCEPIWFTNPDGYTKELNVENLDYNKFQLEHKKFRHYKQIVLLRRVKCGSKNMVLSIVNNLDLNSFR